MATTTRTLNPIPFQDLEPKRFEDLVRQLAYDFRLWRKLEATGRSGGDDGFDARGYEIVNADSPIEAESEVEDPPDPAANDRLWLIQCKRERTISPAKMRAHLDAIPAMSLSGLYGVILAACCDLSKKTRDTFNEWCREKGISEGHIWGKAEIEDRIYQPKNDHILFAYFGISLQIRRRSIRTALRARLATKRRCEKVLSPGQTVLLRDPEDERYPYIEECDATNKAKWRVVQIEEIEPRGVAILKFRYFAYLDDDGVSWDCLDKFNENVHLSQENSWITKAEEETYLRDRAEINKYWSMLPVKNRAWVTQRFVLPFEEILAIDESGDDWASYPHIYVSSDIVMPFPAMEVSAAGAYQSAPCYADDETRMSAFPPELRHWRSCPRAAGRR